ncbi:MAG: ATP-dependent helicase HrpB, partial [Cyclobacteriaceae bacterium]
KFVEEIHEKTKGDLLVFLPGQGEIMQTMENLRELSGTIVRPLYGALPFSQQWKAIQPSQDGKRRIVLATSIAETSLTIEGITTVVDSGYGRGIEYDPGSGLSRLITYRISKDEADQRSGRAGRLGPGQAYRMWSMSTQDKMKAHRTPEIESQDLTSLCLNLASWGNTNAETLLWMSPPPEGTLVQGFDLLEDLGAVANRKITPTGKEMNRLPCHPRIAHMLLEAHKIDQVHLAADIAAIIEEKDPLPRDTGPDLSLRVEWLRRKRADKDTGFSFIRLDRVASSYTQLFHKETSTVPFNPYDCGLLLSFAYPERIGNAQGARSGRFQLANGHIVKLPQKDDLSAEAWLAVANMDARDNLGKVYLASAINPKDLASQVKEVEIIKWDKKKKAVTALHQKRIGSLVLSSKTISEPDKAVMLDILIGEVKKSKGILLPFDEKVVQWLNRAELVSQHSPDAGLPDVKKESLIWNCETWLTPYLSGIVSAEELQQLDLLEILSYSLDVSQQEMMKAWVPERIVVPSGSNLKINYRPDGQAPILEVRIQEMFGMLETPAVCRGKQKILLHLLSPGYKPVQVTDDLESFWSNTYFKVKKELKRRYPKHWWPENPDTAKPTSRAKPRKKN